MTERRIPKDMMRAPESAVQAKTSKGVMPSRITARFENISLDKCPVCQTTLRCSVANGIDVMVCDTHNIVMPKKD